MGNQPDVGGGFDIAWQRSLGTAEQLLAHADEVLREELLISQPPTPRAHWFDHQRTAVEIAAAALYRSAYDGSPTAARLCEVARAAASPTWMLFADLPVSPETRQMCFGSTLTAPGPGFVQYTIGLRLLRAFSCPGSHGGGTELGCVRVGERLASTPHSLSWQAVAAGRIVNLSDRGAGTASCQQCGAERGWMFARPSNSGEWIWRLCHCGDAEAMLVDTSSDIHALAWQDVGSTAQLEGHVRAEGFGRLAPWSEPGAKLGRNRTPASVMAGVLPAMSRGGDARWRSALRAAADLLASAANCDLPRQHNGSLDNADICSALGLAALMLHAVSLDTGLSPAGLDFPRILAAGPDTVHARLAAHLPDAEALTALHTDDPAWEYRHSVWPHGAYGPGTHETSTDPATVAWAHLAVRGHGPEQAPRTPSARGTTYRQAYNLLTGMCTAA